MAYNLSIYGNTTSLAQQYTAVDASTGGWLSIILLLAVFFISYAVSKKTDDYKDFVLSTFVTSVFAILMLLGSFIEWHIAAVPIISFFVSLLFYGMN